MNSIPLNLTFRRNPLCPFCYCELTGANAWTMFQVLWCVDCARAIERERLKATAKVLFEQVAPMDKAHCRGIVAYTPACVSSVSLLLAFDVEDRPVVFDEARLIRLGL